eukprot:GFUD01066735.1.p1 GENE.GFUD01066735.1~~GFUD01066735.1.p1  ORF type:complete len:227 (+),score=38.88 GFUD01066735.1:56-736(+)
MPFRTRLANTGLKLNIPARQINSTNKHRESPSQPANTKQMPQQFSGYLCLNSTAKSHQESPLQTHLEQRTIKDWFFNLSPVCFVRGENSREEIAMDRKKTNENYRIYEETRVIAGNTKIKMIIGKQQSSQIAQPINIRNGFLKASSFNDNIPNMTQIDQNLVQWLHSLCLSRTTIALFSGEELILDDVLEIMSREDWKRVGLKKGPELRIWQAVQNYRNGSHIEVD